MFRGKSLKHGSMKTADEKVRYEPKRFISRSFLYYTPLFENRRLLLPTVSSTKKPKIFIERKRRKKTVESIFKKIDFDEKKPL